jgi:hypothetical protein
MKAKKLMRWTLALTLTGACAALAVMTLDAWTGQGRTARPAAVVPVVTTVPPAVTPEADPPLAGPPAVGAATGPAATAIESPDPASRTIPVGSLAAPRSTRDDTVMLPAAPPVPGGEGRLLEQIETARAGLLAAQSTVPARPAGRATWLPVLFLAGGGGLIGCALGLGLGSLFLRQRGSARKLVKTEPAVALARESPALAVELDDPAESVLQAARAELATRGAQDRTGSPAVSAAPGIAARMQALSRMAAAAELVATAPSRAPSPIDAPSSAARSTGDETAPVHPRRSSFFGITPRRRRTEDPVVPADPRAAGPPARVPVTTSAPATDPANALPVHREETDPVDRRIAALERSLLQVVRAMEEVADRVASREGTSGRPPAAASVRGRDGVEDESGLGLPVVVAPRRCAEDDGELDRDTLAPPMRAPRRRERKARGTAAPPPVATAPSATPPDSPPAAAPVRPVPSVGRAVRALRAARDQAPVAPEPWDLAPAAKAHIDAVVPARREPVPSIPSASTVDGRDLGGIRRAVLRLAAEGWDGGRIAGRLRLGEGDVALILKTAGGEPRLQAAERGQ